MILNISGRIPYDETLNIWHLKAARMTNDIGITYIFYMKYYLCENH